MEKIIGILMILGGVLPLGYFVTSFFKKWRERGNKFVAKALALILISFIFNIGAITVCIGVIIVGCALVSISS
ncbi:hypothetical protein CN326_22545 [Bacillus sp. AFS018417]|uniref:hypothetical protein n=1 Tax=Bacillus sp. AFS018417 TaxID=2033491 RepID=UPI000BF802F5|nr:hypothetical protein [Bacillus sp. AFS018417]PEZ00675.1 hypothetical protein CN326_22545 [Bacillus sp. AFS018417]